MKDRKRIDHDSETLNGAFGMSEEDSARMSERIVNIFNGDVASMSEKMVQMVRAIRMDEFGEDVEPSMYESKLVYAGYVLAKMIDKKCGVEMLRAVIYSASGGNTMHTDELMNTLSPMVNEPVPPQIMMMICMAVAELVAGSRKAEPSIERTCSN